MKKFLLVAAMFLTVSVFAQEKKAEWPELKAFHGVMSKSFHPAEENNLKPLKDNATELATKAKALQISVVPQGYNAELAKPILKRLVKQTKVVEKAVKKGKDDATLKAEITKAHDIFHELVEKCRPGAEDHNH